MFSLFSDENDFTEENIPGTADQTRALRRATQTTQTLEYLRRRCDFLLAERPGVHGNAHYRERRVAQEAYLLIRRHGKEPASGIASSTYGEITSLLWEAITGEPGKDLQRACKAALRAAQHTTMSACALSDGATQL